MKEIYNYHYDEVELYSSSTFVNVELSKISLNAYHSSETKPISNPIVNKDLHSNHRFELLASRVSF